MLLICQNNYSFGFGSVLTSDNFSGDKCNYVANDYCSTPSYNTHYAVCMRGLMLTFALAYV